VDFPGEWIYCDPAPRAKAIVQAAKNFDNPEKLLEAGKQLGDAMPGQEIGKIAEGELLQTLADGRRVTRHRPI
jgi:pyridoxal biosynthesis lyase PdxS